MTDTELLDWLEFQAQQGASPGLINDDAGHWAVSFTGIQNVPENPPQDIMTSFFVEKHQWRPSIREAILAAIEMEKEE